MSESVHPIRCNQEVLDYLSALVTHKHTPLSHIWFVVIWSPYFYCVLATAAQMQRILSYLILNISSQHIRNTNNLSYVPPSWVSLQVVPVWQQRSIVEDWISWHSRCLPFLLLTNKEKTWFIHHYYPSNVWNKIKAGKRSIGRAPVNHLSWHRLVARPSSVQCWEAVGPLASKNAPVDLYRKRLSRHTPVLFLTEPRQARVKPNRADQAGQEVR